jgi:hypothetical protein
LSIEVLIKRLLVVLTYVPAAAVTFTVIVQTLFADKVPPLSFIPGSPAFNMPLLLSVSDPPQVFVVVVFASVIPVGNVSVNVIPATASVVGFVNLMVSREVPPGAIAFGLNDLLIVTTDGPIIFAIREPVL